MKKIKSILMFLVLTFSMSFCSKNVDVISMQEFQNNILNDKSIVLDVRTEEEWDLIGKPDGDKIGLKTYKINTKENSE